MGSYTYAELTVAEQGEVTERRFPQGNNIRYITNAAYRSGWKLKKFVRVGRSA